ncbi:MAG: nicotinate-nucleotide adenylyltransferase [Arenimonas sp.]
MRLLYGGTFDPVHEGHLAIARAAAGLFGQPVHLLPSADPPHRAPPGASAAQRVSMLELAAGGDRRLRVDQRELGREGPSYSVDTLAQVRAEVGPELPVVWILGLDSLRDFDSWHDWRRILALAHVLGVERPGTAPAADWLRAQTPAVHDELLPRWSAPLALARAPAGLYAPMPMQPLRTESATEVRRRIAEGLDWTPMVPARVARFIIDQGLYRPLAGRTV